MLQYLQMSPPTLKASASAVMEKVSFAASFVRYIWVVAIFLVMGGASFVHFQSSLVQVEDFKPIEEAVKHQLPLIVKKVEQLEANTQGAEKAVTEIRTQLTLMTSTLGRIDQSQDKLHKQVYVMALCGMHRDTYVAQLVDYSAGVRKTIPARSEGYKRCLTVMTEKVHGG